MKLLLIHLRIKSIEINSCDQNQFNYIITSSSIVKNSIKSFNALTT